MADEVELREPVHPEAREELEKRLALVEAMEAERDLLREAGKVTPSPSQRDMFNHMASSLGRIIDRWKDGTVYIVDKSKMAITPVGNDKE